MMLRVAFDCGADAAGSLATVFASRSGEIWETVSLLECLAGQRPLTATRFSHSVHNTPAGLFAIRAGNRQSSSSVAAGRETFACAFLEAVGLLARNPGSEVLLVAADEPLPPILRRFADEPQGLHAVALHLVRDPEIPAIQLDIDTGGDQSRYGLPPAMEFLRWMLSGEPSLTLPGERRRWTWRRAEESGAAPPAEDE
jgi:hypothetical protein